VWRRRWGRDECPASCCSWPLLSLAPAQDPRPITSAEATLLLAKLGDPPSYAKVLGWFRSGAADASVCVFVLRDAFEFPVAELRYDELLAAMSRDPRCADQAQEINRRSVRRRDQGG
jgi:hypothetical protein